MASLAEIARIHTSLDRAPLAHLQRLVAGWGLLADFSFADLMLLAPVGADADGDAVGDKFVVLAQIRPTTSQTVYREDWVGRALSDIERPLVARSYRLSEKVEGEINLPAPAERVRVQCVPVLYNGHVIGVLTRETAPSRSRLQGDLERTYHSIFQRFADMIAAGLYPFPNEDPTGEDAPRVGDGVLLLDDRARIVYASPNAVSAMHRIGVHAVAPKMRLGELGFQESMVLSAFTTQASVTEEIERGPEVTVAVRCIPLLASQGVTGGVVLLRDVSELRRRDRLLISKDATIREIHHRVKNNLQTISSLLRIQSRRLGSDEAKMALAESVRRIQAIALVHETLSREAGDDVPFAEIVRPLVRIVEEGLLAGDGRVRFQVTGDAGKLPSIVATPMAVVLNELLQNAVDHAFPRGTEHESGSVVIELSTTVDGLLVRVTDNGVGVDADFSLDNAGLGLSIVRTLVESELEGTITVHRANEDAGGTAIEITAPIRYPTPAAETTDAP